MANIYSLPNELLQQILLETSPAHALTLVSHRISTLYAPYRFRDVAVSGIQKLTALLSALDAADPSDVRMERLFLCDYIREETGDDIFQALAHSVSRNDRYSQGIQVTSVLAGILRHAAPHARAICVLSFNEEYDSSLGCLCELSFPALRHLAFRPAHGVMHYSMEPAWDMPVLQTLVLPEVKEARKRLTTETVILVFCARAARLEEITIVDVNVKHEIRYGAVAFVKHELPQTFGEYDHEATLLLNVGARLRIEMRNAGDAQPGLVDTSNTRGATDEGYSWDGWQWRLVSDAARGYMSYDQWRAEYEARKYV